MDKESGLTWKLGMFVVIGLILFVFTIYYVGKQKNLFGATFQLRTQFKSVSGLEVGNNVRFSGINIGTVDEIELITDTSVMVELLIKKEFQQFIKAINEPFAAVATNEPAPGRRRRMLATVVMPDEEIPEPGDQ